MFKNVARRRLIAIDVRVSSTDQARESDGGYPPSLPEFYLPIATWVSWSGKNENMRADVQSIQSTHHIYCPLCHAPLTCRTSNSTIGITNGTSSSHVFCSSCGYSAPLMAR